MAPTHFGIKRVVKTANLLLNITLTVCEEISTSGGSGCHSVFLSAMLTMFLANIARPLRFVFVFYTLPLCVICTVLRKYTFTVSKVVRLEMRSFKGLRFVAEVPVSVGTNLNKSVVGFIVYMITFFVVKCFMTCFVVNGFGFTAPKELKGCVSSGTSSRATSTTAATGSRDKGASTGSDGTREVVTLLKKERGVVLISTYVAELHIAMGSLSGMTRLTT